MARQMINKKNNTDYYIGRISSIIKTHFMLFATPYMGLDFEPEKDYEKLLDFHKYPESAKIKRIISIVKAYALLHDSGLLSSNAETEKETAKLVRYLSSLQRDHVHSGTVRKLVPKNLGFSFFKKKLGVPLFGLYRPSSVPGGKGMLLCYTSTEGDGEAGISAVMMDRKTSINYQGLGVVVDSEAKWLHCVISRAGNEPLLIPEIAFKRKKAHTFDFFRYNISLAEKAIQTRLKDEFIDPFRYKYAYFFFDDSTLKFKVLRFLSSLLSGKFCVPARESENIALLFIQKLL
jgi:hypothetical protein